MTKEVLDIFDDSKYIPTIIEGYNATAPPSGSEAVWPASSIYTFPASPLDMTMSSDSSEDDTGKTGSYTVEVVGLSSNGEGFRESITLDGTTPVKISSPIYRVLEFKVVEAGSSLSNVGNIYIGTGTVTAGVPAVIYGMIELAEGAEKKAVYSVPLHTKFYLTSITLFPNFTDTDIIEWELEVYDEGHKVKTYRNTVKSELTYRWEPDFPIMFDSNTDLILNTIRTSATGGKSIPVRARMEGILKRR
jgi:hypothetical protein